MICMLDFEKAETIERIEPFWCCVQLGKYKAAFLVVISHDPNMVEALSIFQS